MNKKLCSITSTISLLALALFTAPGCALLGLEEEEEETETTKQVRCQTLRELGWQAVILI